MLIKTINNIKYLTFEIKFNGLDNFEYKYTINYVCCSNHYFLIIPDSSLFLSMCKPSSVDDNADILLSNLFQLSIKDSIIIAKFICDNF